MSYLLAFGFVCASSWHPGWLLLTIYFLESVSIFMGLVVYFPSLWKEKGHTFIMLVETEFRVVGFIAPCQLWLIVWEVVYLWNVGHNFIHVFSRPWRLACRFNCGWHFFGLFQGWRKMFWRRCHLRKNSSYVLNLVVSKRNIIRQFWLVTMSFWLVRVVGRWGYFSFTSAFKNIKENLMWVFFIC